MSRQYKYSMDAGALITAHRFRYSMDIFPSWWAWVDNLITQDMLFLCIETYNEITPGDPLYVWAQQKKQTNPNFVRQTGSSETQIWSGLPNRVPKLSHPSSAKGPDRFIIAHAYATGAAVVTEERRSGGPHVVKIPDVCQQLNIECINLLDFMRREGASF